MHPLPLLTMGMLTISGALELRSVVDEIEGISEGLCLWGFLFSRDAVIDCIDEVETEFDEEVDWLRGTAVHFMNRRKRGDGEGGELKDEIEEMLERLSLLILTISSLGPPFLTPGHKERRVMHR